MMYLKTMWQNIKQHWKLLLVVILTSMGTTIGFLLLPIMTQYAIDNSILTLTKTPWYKTTMQDESVLVNNQYYTQNSAQAIDAGKPIIVAYEGVTSYFIFDVPKGTKSIEVKDGKAYFADNQNTNLVLMELSKQDVYALYEPNIPSLLKTLTLYLAVVLMHPFFAWFNSIYVRRFSRNVIADFRIKGMEKLQKLPMDYFTKRQDGKFISYLISDVSMFYSLASNIGVQLLQAFIMFLGIYILLFFLDVRLFLGALVFLPLLACWIYFYRRKISGYYESARSASSALNALLNEQFKGITVIRAFAYEEHAKLEFNALNDAVYDYNKKSLKLKAFGTGSIVNVLRRTMWIAILIYAGSLYFNAGKVGLTIGTIYLLVSYVNYYVEPLYQLFSIITIIEQANVSIQRYFRYLEEDEETERADAIWQNQPRFRGDITFENVSFGYTEANLVLKQINLTVKANQTVAIVGHTGSGKSSLMNLLLRFYDYTSGKILVDGIEIQAMRREVYREHVGIILQDPVLFKGTLMDTITWGDAKYSAEFVEQILREIGAGDLLDHPQGLKQLVSEMGQNFSLGQRQLIAFARAVIQNPSILVLDEATANIDTQTERKIQKALTLAAQNRTTFIIAHRLSTIRDADIIVVLDNGNLVEQGTHEQLLSQNGYYTKMYAAQSTK
ncbi:MAG: ABC transporter ATP-binding protein [Culicoidibacterales bacterium]